MPRQKPEYAGTSWQDVAEAVSAWEIEKGVRVRIHICWQSILPTGAYVEAVLYDHTTSFEPKELCRVRNAFPARKAAGQAGAVMYCIFEAFNALEREPWLWPSPRRAQARGEG